MNYQVGDRILVVAAHPDDEVLGVGGAIPIFVDEGATVDLIISTDGSSTQYENNEHILEEKFKEAQEAAKILGINDIFRLPFPDMRLDTVPHAEVNQALEKLLRENRYNTVFVQDKGDINLDHKRIYHSVLVACRPSPNQIVRRVFSYYVNSSSEWGGIESQQVFTPNVYVDIKKTISKKLEAMNAYKSELRDYPHPRSLESIRNSAEYFGNQVGYEFAEPFKLILSR